MAKSLKSEVFDAIDSGVKISGSRVMETLERRFRRRVADEILGLITEGKVWVNEAGSLEVPRD